MNILCITHADFESPGIIEDWAKERSFGFQVTRPYRFEALSDNFDALIVMGGPQSPLTIDETPYLHDEIALIKKTLEMKKPTLGFCLGAQLIGEAMGAKTQKSPQPEIGVFDITQTQEAHGDPLLKDLDQTFPVIHWHNDMPGIPSSATILATSLGCPRQIVRFAKNVYGFQCHLEITTDGIRDMIKACPDDLLKQGPFIQNQETLLKQDYASINLMMKSILDRFISL